MKKILLSLGIGALIVLIPSCNSKEKNTMATLWEPVELTFISNIKYENPYTDVFVWAEFNHNGHKTIQRPAFWDGGDTFKIRFASPIESGKWTYTVLSSDTSNKGLHGVKGQIVMQSADSGENQGLLTISDGKRNVIYHNGKPFLVVGDTPWALPFRATAEMARKYASDRQEKGFNTALLMTVQPDTEAQGPEERGVSEGFARGFADLHEGHLNKLNPAYFQYFDLLVDILLEHEIVPVYQPVFHGFGWKGQKVLGNFVDPQEYERYMIYLIARYGARPAFWLVSADGDGEDPGVTEAGEAVEKWDAYQQPAGIHYNPCADYMADFAKGKREHICLHYNRTHQASEWLDFQWAQTGHNGEHLTKYVAEMYDNKPTKAVLNGEPTYEGMGGGQYGLGWWQGHEAWTQLMAGGTMGIVYGAASLWQFKYFEDEPGWGDWASTKAGWETTLGAEGSIYAGLVAKAFEGFYFVDMQRKPEWANGHPLLAVPDTFYITYLSEGEEITLSSLKPGLPYRFFNPKTGEFTNEGSVEQVTQNFNSPQPGHPWVLIVGKREY